VGGAPSLKGARDLPDKKRWYERYRRTENLNYEEVASKKWLITLGMKTENSKNLQLPYANRSTSGNSGNRTLLDCHPLLLTKGPSTQDGRVGVGQKKPSL